MNSTDTCQLWPLKPNVLDLIGFKETSAHSQVKVGTLPPPIRYGKQAKRFISSEIKAVVAARVAGASEDEIKALVKRLVAARKSSIGVLLAST